MFGVQFNPGNYDVDTLTLSKEKFVPEYPGQMSPKVLKQFEKTKKALHNYFVNNYDTFNGAISTEYKGYNVFFSEPKHDVFHLELKNTSKGSVNKVTYSLNKFSFDRIMESKLSSAVFGDIYRSSNINGVKTIAETIELNKLFKGIFKVLKKIR